VGGEHSQTAGPDVDLALLEVPYFLECPHPGALPYNLHWANVITDFAPRVKNCPLQK